jgi:hypothetical protein
VETADKRGFDICPYVAGYLYLLQRPTSGYTTGAKEASTARCNEVDLMGWPFDMTRLTRTLSSFCAGLPKKHPLLQEDA